MMEEDKEEEMSNKREKNKWNSEESDVASAPRKESHLQTASEKGNHQLHVANLLLCEMQLPKRSHVHDNVNIVLT